MNRNVLKEIFSAFVVVWLVFSLASFDFFGFGNSLDKQSEQNFQSVLDGFRGVPSGYGADIADDILVVHYTDENFEKDGWPIPAQKLETFIRAMAGAEAVFIDIAFETPRIGAEEAAFCAFVNAVAEIEGLEVADLFWFEEIIANSSIPGSILPDDCITAALNDNELGSITPYQDFLIDPGYRESKFAVLAKSIRNRRGTPIFIGATTSYFLQGLPNQVQPVAPGSLREHGVVQQLILDQLALMVPIEVYDRATGGYYPYTMNAISSPAFAMAKHWVCNEDAAPVKDLTRLYCESALPVTEPSEDEVFWYQALDWSGHSRQSERQGTCMPGRLRVPKMLSVLLFGQVKGTSIGRHVTETRCFRFETVDFDDVLTAHAGSELEPFEGRFVFFGVDVKVLGDIVDAPVQGRIPAVHTHATAFENLLRPGHPRRHWSLSSSAWLLTLEVTILFIAYIVFRSLRNAIDTPDCLVSGAHEPNIVSYLRRVNGDDLSQPSGWWYKALKPAAALYASCSHLLAGRTALVLGAVAITLGAGVFGGMALPYDDASKWGRFREGVAGTSALGLGLIFFVTSLTLHCSSCKRSDETCFSPSRSARAAICATLLVVGALYLASFLPAVLGLSAASNQSVSALPTTVLENVDIAGGLGDPDGPDVGENLQREEQGSLVSRSTDKLTPSSVSHADAQGIKIVRTNQVSISHEHEDAARKRELMRLVLPNTIVLVGASALCLLLAVSFLAEAHGVCCHDASGWKLISSWRNDKAYPSFLWFWPNVINDLEKRMIRSGPHIVMLALLSALVFVISMTFAWLFNRSAPNTFEIFFAIVAAYWVVFREQVEEDTRINSDF